MSGYHGGPYDVSEIVGYDKERDEMYVHLFVFSFNCLVSLNLGVVL